MKKIEVPTKVLCWRKADDLFSHLFRKLTFTSLGFFRFFEHIKVPSEDLLEEEIRFFLEERSVEGPCTGFCICRSRRVIVLRSQVSDA